MRDLQKAAVSKRLFAFLADLIVASILIAGVYFVLSAILNIDQYNDRYDEIRLSYEERYGVTFGLDEEAYNALDESGRENYKNAVDAMNADEEANAAVRTAILLTAVIFAAGILLSLLILEFVVPLLFRDGRTLGKKLFGLGVMRKNYLHVGAPALFVRGIIGKGVLELILPVFILVTVRSGITGIFGLLLLAGMLIAQVITVFKTESNSFLHDVLADTVVIDWNSQAIFDSEEERDAYFRESDELSAKHDPY